MSSSASSTKKRHPVGRLFAFLGVTLVCVILTLLGLIWVLERGPSPTVTGMFTRSVRETSAIRWISNIFLTDEELENSKSVSTENTVTEAVNTSLIHIAEGTQSLPPSESIRLIDIAEGTCKGKLLIVSDPKQVILGTSDEFVRQPGLLLTDMVAKYDGIAGINAGGFNDENGSGNGGIPQGLVITNGEIVWGDANTPYHMVGLDADGILHVGAMSGNTAVEQGIQWAVSFITHDGLASSLIINGEVQRQNLGGGVNPRTALGQRADGALLLLVLDGRSINTLGATMEDVVNIMLEYGAVNAGNLDGGHSSAMYFNGQSVYSAYPLDVSRRMPATFMVKP